MASVTVAATESAFPPVRLPKFKRNPLLCSFVFLSCDAVSLILTACLSILGSAGADKDIHRYLLLWPLSAVFFVIFALSDLYPGIIHNPITELRRLTLGLTVSFTLIASLTAIIQPATNFPYGTLIGWWLAALIVTPALRSVARELVCCRSWWGVPVAVFHTGEESLDLIKELERQPEIGLRPVVLLASPQAARPKHKLPVLDLRATTGIRACGVERAMIAMPASGCGKLLTDLEQLENMFPRLMIMHASSALCSLAVDAREIGGSLAVEVRRDLLLPLPRLVKRFIDLCVVALSLPVVGLAVLLLGLLVRLESPGPVFYGHPRVGRDRFTFRAWKIRTMQVDGERLLEEVLARDEALRKEWLRDRKLRRDPRVTRVGRFLRKTSLDELPQLWNVLRGEMSLVGPRPIVEEEIAAYGSNFSLYCRVTPGITGLWQVSGRNAVSVSDRVRLDCYYVRNWSPWLDLHILARTARVVLTGQGAY